jgi:hypothetical protein
MDGPPTTLQREKRAIPERRCCRRNRTETIAGGLRKGKRPEMAKIVEVDGEERMSG